MIEEHTERTLEHEEIYVVVSGRARFTVDGDDAEVGPGTFVYVRDPPTKRGAIALEDGTTVLAVSGKPGAAYEPSAWDWTWAAEPFRARGDYEGALAVVREALDEMPGPPGAVHYDIARYEALLGRRDAALYSLRTAVAAWDHWAGPAHGADDFASLRGDPEFLAITGQTPAPGSGA